MSKGHAGKELGIYWDSTATFSSVYIIIGLSLVYHWFIIGLY